MSEHNNHNSQYSSSTGTIKEKIASLNSKLPKFETIYRQIATFGSIGFLNPASGTIGTAAAIPLAFILDSENILQKALFIFMLAVIGVISADYYSKQIGKEDPSQVVIDEVVGYLITVMFFKLTLVTAVLGFLLFRFFDILKPFPCKQLEALHGGYGIMLDDVMAGIYAALSLGVILWLM